MFEQRRWPRLPWIPIVAGCCWLWAGGGAGLGTFFLLLPAGGLLFASGVSLLLWPGDRRVPQTLALASVLGVLLWLPACLAVGFVAGTILAVLAGACFPVAGGAAVWQEPHTEGTPVPRPSLALALKVGVDETILGMEQLQVGLPMGREAHRMSDEIHLARQLYADRGWLEDPAAYHQTPKPLEQPEVRRKHIRGFDYEHVYFESEYEPHLGEPGRERWLGYRPTRTAHAWVLRHEGAERPWLVCNNGYRMGRAPLDLRIFGEYHRELGLNVLIPVLPLHGARRIGWQSGEGFLSGEVLDSVHAEAQAMWDIRRLIGWLRESQGASAVGAYGISLGGYTTALLAGLQEGLACAIAGIPVVDFARIFWRHGPKLQLDYWVKSGTEEEQVAEALKVVSPLAIDPLVAPSGRMVFGGVADRLVTPDHVRDLARHWGDARTVWYDGAHCTFGLDPRVGQGIRATLRDAKLTGPEG